MDPTPPADEPRPNRRHACLRGPIGACDFKLFNDMKFHRNVQMRRTLGWSLVVASLGAGLSLPTVNPPSPGLGFISGVSVALFIIGMYLVIVPTPGALRSYSRSALLATVLVRTTVIVLATLGLWWSRDLLLEGGVNSGSLLAVRLALALGADVEHPCGYYNDRLLSHAAARGDIPMMRFLLERGADINGRSKIGNTPLFAAIQSSSGAEFLLQNGAYCNVVSRSGRTPLLLAAHFKRFEIMSLLVRYGASPTLGVPRGKNVCSVACDNAVSRQMCDEAIQRGKQQVAGRSPRERVRE